MASTRPLSEGKYDFPQKRLDFLTFFFRNIFKHFLLPWFSSKRVEMTDRILFSKSLVFSQNSIDLTQTWNSERKLKNIKNPKLIFQIGCQKLRHFWILCLKIDLLMKSASQPKASWVRNHENTESRPSLLHWILSRSSSEKEFHMKNDLKMHKLPFVNEILPKFC